MPIPTELLDKQLIGSRWTRRVGKHRGTEVTILSFNDAGVKFEVRTRNSPGVNQHLRDKRFGSVQWPMFTTLYEPEGILPMIVTIDKEGYVVKTPRVDLTKRMEISSPGLAAKLEGIIKEEDMPAPVEPVKVETSLCRGPWHYKSGKGTALPVSEFDINNRTHGLNKTCRGCILKANESVHNKNGSGRVLASTIVQTKPKFVMVEPEKPIVEVPAPVEIPVSVNPGKYQWKVTVIEPVEKIIWADDLLDVQVKAGEVDVVKVERL